MLTPDQLKNLPEDTRKEYLRTMLLLDEKKKEQAIKDAAQAFDLFKGVGRDIAMLITETLGPALLKLGKYLKDLDISNLSFTIFGKFIGFGTGNDPEIKINAITAEIEKLQAVKAIAMANLDIACHRDGSKSSLEQSILLTTDGLDSAGFLEHLKLPHYVTFRSMMERKIAVRNARPTVQKGDKS